MPTANPTAVNCPNCGGTFDHPDTLLRCPYCGSLVQVAAAVLAKSLRIETIDDVATVLIPHSVALPTAINEIFSTSLDNQAAVEIHLLQGEAERASQNRSLGRFVFREIPPAPRAVPQIQFTFSVSEAGLLRVEVKDLGSGKQVTYQGIQVEVIRKE